MRLELVSVLSMRPPTADLKSSRAVSEPTIGLYLLQKICRMSRMKQYRSRLKKDPCCLFLLSNCGRLGWLSFFMEGFWGIGVAFRCVFGFWRNGINGLERQCIPLPCFLK